MNTHFWNTKALLSKAKEVEMLASEKDVISGERLVGTLQETANFPCFITTLI